jgi:hypothetical protein
MELGNSREPLDPLCQPSHGQTIIEKAAVQYKPPLPASLHSSNKPKKKRKKEKGKRKENT